MVRSAELRRKKYDLKVVPSVVADRFTALKPSMLEQVTTKYTDLVTMETDVKTKVLEPAGVATIQIPFYLNYARQLYSLTQRFSGKSLEIEAKIAHDKWVARGLTSDTLKAIAELFGITWTEGGGP